MVYPRALLLTALVVTGEARALEDYWGESASSLEECRARHPDVHRPKYWTCFYLFALEHGERLAAIKSRLRETLRRDPGLTYGALVRAAMTDRLEGADPSMDLYRPIQAEFRRRGDHLGELITTVAMIESSAWNAFAETGWRLYARALEIASEMNDPDARAMALMAAAELANGLLDYGRAERLVREAEATATPRGPWWLHMKISATLGRTLSATGRPLEALHIFDRAADWAEHHSSSFRAPIAQSAAEEAVRLVSADLLPAAEAERRLEEARALAQAAHLKILLTSGELPVSLLQAAMRGPTPESVSVARAALAQGETNDQPFLIGTALRLLSRFSIESDPLHPELARPWVRRLHSRAVESESPLDLALAELAQAHLDWRSGDAAGLDRDAVATLDAVDRLRWLQPEGLVRARTSAEWAFAYELLSGWTLDGAGPDPGSAALERALATMERLRGRVLLDELTRSGVAPGAVAPELSERRRHAMADLAKAQRVLVGENPASVDQTEAKSRLRQAETALADTDDAIARAHPASMPAPVASMRELQAALRSDEAILSFQLWRPDLSFKAPYPEGRSWLVVLSHGDAFATPLPDAHRLDGPVRMLQALIREGDTSASAAGEELGEQLLGLALTRLGPSIRTLIVVPDGPLLAFPLETLLLPDGRPLADRYAVSTVPSASLWLRWGTVGHGGSGPVLAMADPQAASAPGAQRDAARWLQALELPSLPHARTEAASLVAAMGQGSMLRLGAEATESFLKTNDLRPWSVLHFATHAVVDETEPDRSALVLAPGNAEEDGLLQPREIAQLNLEGKVVLLSACRTASGHQILGEGAFGLARAFFRAGAQAVVASPWPIGDLEARDLIGELAARLGEGRSLNDALAEAKRARRSAGAPTVAWAGLQLYGNGRVVPRPSAPNWTAPIVAVGAFLAMFAAVLGSLALRRRRPGYFRRTGSSFAGPAN